MKFVLIAYSKPDVYLCILADVYLCILADDSVKDFPTWLTIN